MKLPVKLAAYPPPEFQWYLPGSCPSTTQAQQDGPQGGEGSVFLIRPVPRDPMGTHPPQSGPAP